MFFKGQSFPPAFRSAPPAEDTPFIAAFPPSVWSPAPLPKQASLKALPSQLGSASPAPTAGICDISTRHPSAAPAYANDLTLCQR